MIFITTGFHYSLDYALLVIVILVTYWMLFYQTMLSFNSCLFQCIYWYCNVIYTLLCTCTFSHFTHHWEFLTPWSCTSRFMIITFYWSGIWGGAHAFRGVRVLFAWSSNLGISSCLLSFLFIFLWFSITRTLYLFYWFIRKIILSCIKIICHIVVIFNAFIVDWYNLLESL